MVTDHAGEVIVFCKEVAIGGVDEGHVEPPSVFLGLVQTCRMRLVFRLCLDDRNSQRRKPYTCWKAQHIIGAALSATGTPVNDVNATSGGLTADEVLRPPSGIQGRVNQLGTGVSFRPGHGF